MILISNIAISRVFNRGIFEYVFLSNRVFLRGVLLMLILYTSYSRCAPLEPKKGILAGVNIDVGVYSPESFNAAIKYDHAFFSIFTAWPPDYGNLDWMVGEISKVRGTLVLSPEPWVDLNSITDKQISDLALKAKQYADNYGVCTLIRFAHEMNGDWYPWGGQPVKYNNAFERMAMALHATTPNAGMVWAPISYSGYPFGYNGMDLNAYLNTSKPHGTAADFYAMDTNGNGVLDGDDDPYGPYYPGDNLVDWVGLSVYHWGNYYNAAPGNREFTSFLSGGGNWWHSFYDRFAAGKQKPLVIPETSAMFCHSWAGDSDVSVKGGWLEQVYHADASTAYAQSLPNDFPWLKGVGWFDINKYEGSVDAIIDWRISEPMVLRNSYQGKLAQVVDGSRYFVSGADLHGFVYGWNGFSNGWESVDPGCSFSLINISAEGSGAMRLDYDGSGTKLNPNIAVKTLALHDADWSENSTIMLYARAPGSSSQTVEVILQSNITPWDPLGTITVPADGSWHPIIWDYSPSNHIGASLLNIYLALHIVTNEPATLYVDRFAMAPPPPKKITASKGTFEDKVQISWRSSAGASKYRVFRNTENKSYNAVEISGEITGTTFEDTLAQHGKLYYYWIKSGIKNDWSSFSFCANGYLDLELLNPGFELQGSGGADDPASWGSYNAYRDSKYSHSGSWSLKISDGGWHNALQLYGYGDLGGETIIAEVYAMTTGLSGGKGGLLKLQKSGTTENYNESWFITSDSPTGEWIKGTVSATLPAYVSNLEIVLLLDGGDPPTTGTVYFDDVSVIIPEAATTLFLLLNILFLSRKFLE